MISDITPPKKPHTPAKKKTIRLDALRPDERPVPFVTPEQAAAVDDLPPTDASVPPIDELDTLPTEDVSAAIEPVQAAKKPWWRLTRRQGLIAGIIGLVLLGGAFGAWLALRSNPAPAKLHATIIVAKQPPVPTTVPSTLTGLPVSPIVNQQPVTGVMIENSDFARPQSGLSQAGVVFEAIAEGGITRFLALFQDTAPTNVGPIRSVRPYYEQWALGFDASLAHVGGSPEALADIKTWQVKDLDQFYNGDSYHRISTRVAPHNVYTGIPTLNQLEQSKGFTTANYTGFPRKTPAPAKTPTVTTINLNMSGPDFDVTYKYDPATNTYKRSEGGAPHIDANTNAQISPTVVIAMVMPYSLEADGYHSDYGTIGSGQAYVFQDGGVTQGQWAKSSNTSQFTFTDANGALIKLNPGQTWLTAVATAGDVSYQP